MVDLTKTVVVEGLKAVARAATDGDPAAALRAAGAAAKATHVVGGIASSARKAAGALRDAVEQTGGAPGGVQPPRAPQQPLDEVAAQVQAKAEASGLQALVASARAAYRSQRIAAGLDPDNDAIAKTGQAVRNAVPVIMDKTGALVDMATPAGADGLKRFGRGLARKLTGADVAAEIARVDTWKGMVAGTSKLGYLGVLLGRMGQADVGVFQALDAFSNHNTERNKALTKISQHIYDLRVDAETAVATLKGFQLTNGKPDYAERRTALRTLAPNLDRDEVPRVLEGFSDEDEERLKALRTIAELYNTVPALEMVELLKIFGPKTRGKARSVLEPKLADRENLQLIDDLFEPKKTLADFPEIQRLKGGAAELKTALGGFMDAFSKGMRK